MHKPIRTGPISPLSELRLDIAACNKCALSESRNQAVPGDGEQSADIVLIGEAPGQNEDKTGYTFCGKSGNLLDEWLVRAGFPYDGPRQRMFLTNVIKCQPPNNWWKGAEVVDAPSRCIPYLEKQLKIVQPRAVIIAGRNAAQWALLRGAAATADPYGPWVGRLCRRRDLYGETRFACIWHPAFILRNENPYEEAKCVEVLTKIREYVDAVKAEHPAPLEDLYDVRPVGRVEYQQRMRLFLPPPPAESPKEENTE